MLFRILVFLLFPLVATAATLIERDGPCLYLPGWDEASLPDTTAWRFQGFDASSWTPGQMALYFENQPGSANSFTGNTVLSDMFGNYTCVFTRQTFEVGNIYDFGALLLEFRSDDGFIAWINGFPVARFNMPDGDIPVTGTSNPALPEPIEWVTNTITDLQSFLVPGVNVLAVQAFNSSKGNSSDFIINTALRSVPDTTAPVIALLSPPANATVRALNKVEIGFSKPVTGVDAADLLVNGQPATTLTVLAPDQYLFGFAQPPTGPVQIAWAASHGIRDLSTAGNAFVPSGGWTYTLDPNAPVQSVVISEFMASNSGNLPDSVHDVFGDSPDWIELFNTTEDAVSLTGWSLTDNPSRPDKWVFPPTLLPARSYLLVMASNRDTNAAGQLHTNFRLSASPSYLALIDSGGTVVSAFTPQYPQQFEDVSYGRDRSDPLLLGYFTDASPGEPNNTLGAGFAPEVRFSRSSGVFQNDFTLALSTTDTNCDIRYLVVTNNVPSGSPPVIDVPTVASPLYTGPIPISTSAQVRARAFPRQLGFLPGPPRTECFIRIASTMNSFSSELPLILLHTLGGGGIPQSVDQSVIMMVFEPVNGRTSLTNPPTLVTRAGFNIRGSSTAGMPQASFALEFWDEFNDDKSDELLGMPAESDWVLYGQNGFDPSFLHNPLAHQFSRNVGRYSSRTRFAEVFLNTAGGVMTYSAPAGGNYHGLYTIEEKVKRDSQRVDIQELQAQQTTQPAITGGYLLKIDRADPDERTFYDSFAQTSIVFQDPDGLEMVDASRQAQHQYITGFFSQFGSVLWGPSYTNPVTGYAAYIDVDSWLDHHLLNALAFNVDAMRLSGYFFKDREKKLEMGPLWDFDRSMGTSYGGDVRPFNPRLWRVQQGGDQGTDFFGDPALLGVRWWQRLFSDIDFWQRWIDRWTDLRRGPLAQTNLVATVDAFVSQIDEAEPRQRARWSSTAPRSGTVSANGYSHNFNGTYAGEIAFLKQWLNHRAEFMDTNCLRPPVFSLPGGPVTAGTTLTITASTIEPNSRIYYTVNGTDPRLPGGGVAPGAFSAIGSLNLVVNGNMRVFARNFNAAHFNVTNYPGSVGGNPPLSSPWSGSTVATFVVATPRIAITEMMYNPPPPSAGTNNNDDFEFIELKNTGTQNLALPGFRFTNGVDFTFAATNPITTLAPGKYLVLVRNLAAFQARYPSVTNIAGVYTGSLANGGERVVLEGPMREPILDFEYKDGWQPTTDGLGFSLVIRDESGAPNTWTNPASWRPSSAPLGSPGSPDPAPTFIPQVVINEALTHTDPPQLDTVELLNLSSQPAPIGGWFLSDDPDQPRKYVFPPQAVLQPGETLIVTEDQFSAGTSGFALSSLGDELYLFSGDGVNLTGYRHGFGFGAQLNGITFGRHVASNGKDHFVRQAQPSLTSPNAGPKVGPVVISEIMYAPRAFGSNANTLEEYVELHNPTGYPVNLFDPLHPTNRWKLDDGVQFTFPPGTVMPAGSYLLVVNFDPDQDPFALQWFRARYALGTATPILGPYSGNLSNQGEKIGLYEPDKPEIPPSPVPGFVPYALSESVDYEPAAPWDAAALETGRALSRIRNLAFANDPANWVAGPASPGAAGDFDGDGLPDDWEATFGLDYRSGTGANGPTGDADLDGVNNRNEYIGGTSPSDPVDVLTLLSEPAGETQIALRCKSAPGRIYGIDQRPSLTHGTWTPLVQNIPGTGADLVFYDSVAATPKFYRLNVRLAP